MWKTIFIALSFLFLLITGCDLAGPPKQVLSVLAGSELKDLQPYFETIRKQTGIDLQMEYIGTLDGAEKLAGGAAYDLAWFSHAKYLTLLPETRNRLHAQEKIMLSPVILGVKKSKAEQWGWVGNNNIKWNDIAEKAAGGELAFAMTNPASSNSGFTSLLGVAAAFSGSSSALTSEEVNKQQLKSFFKGQKLTSGSSGWLAEAYVREQQNLDGLINYESVLMSLNDSNQLQEKLYLVYPQEGIVTADYPLMLLDRDKREAYNTLISYLKSEEFQKIVMERTSRRPVNPKVRLSGDFNSAMLVELPFPADRATIDRLIFSYLDEVRLPSSPIFVLDVSGSMKGERLDNLKIALRNLTGLDDSLTGKFARFREREQVTLLPFNQQTYPARTFVVDNIDAQGTRMEEIRQFVAGMQANGGTSIYAALMQAYTLAAAMKQQDSDRFYSIVLLSDGKNEAKMGFDDFRRYYRKLPPEVKEIKTFPILFGNAHKEEMQQVSELTGGRLFDGQTTSLASVFKKIRGYQ